MFGSLWAVGLRAGSWVAVVVVVVVVGEGRRRGC